MAECERFLTLAVQVGLLDVTQIPVAAKPLPTQAKVPNQNTARPLFGRHVIASIRKRLGIRA